MLLFQLGQLILDLADLLRGLLQQRVFLIAELVLGGFDGIQQKIAVILAVLLHGHALVRRQKDLFPKLRILRQDLVFPIHQGLVGGGGLLRLGRVAAVFGLAVTLRAAGGQRQHHQRCQQQRGQFLHLHVDSSVFSSMLIFCFPSPKP